MRTAIGMQTPDETPIEYLDLKVHTYNCLKRAGIHSVGQVLAMDKASLMNTRNFRSEDFNELREKLIAHGIMTPDRPLGPFADEEPEG
jgi:DNA-directed RNA polymerase subunit alpha